MRLGHLQEVTGVMYPENVTRGLHVPVAYARCYMRLTCVMLRAMLCPCAVLRALATQLSLALIASGGAAGWSKAVSCAAHLA